MKTDVVCLYEETGYSADKWAQAGFNVFCYDLEHTYTRIERCGKGWKIFVPWNAFDEAQNIQLLARHANRTAIVLAFPPCTDLTVTGAAWFEKKLSENANYRKEAMQLVYLARNIGESLKCPWVIENPVSVISTEWRKPDYIFNPFEYGGYLPVDDVHPDFPEYINPRDAYRKKTCYWVGGGFRMPPKIPVHVEPGYSKQHRKLGGKSKKTKKIRSASPRGVMTGIFYANAKPPC